MKKINWGFITAVVILVGFPLLAYYYMNKGVNYRKALFDQLEDYGQFLRVKDSLDSKVVAIFSLKEEPAGIEALTQMHSQFDNRKDVEFLVDGNFAFTDTAQIKRITDAGRLKLATALKTPYRELKGSGFLIDRNGHLRKRYDLSQDADIQLFVRQIALFLPPKKTPKAELKREAEK